MSVLSSILKIEMTRGGALAFHQELDERTITPLFGASDTNSAFDYFA